MRVPKVGLLDRSQYEFFAGLDADNTPTWTTILEARQPVFRDSENGVSWTTSASYNPVLNRYFLITEHAETASGYIGILMHLNPGNPGQLFYMTTLETIELLRPVFSITFLINS